MKTYQRKRKPRRLMSLLLAAVLIFSAIPGLQMNTQAATIYWPAYRDQYGSVIFSAVVDSDGKSWPLLEQYVYNKSWMLVETTGKSGNQNKLHLVSATPNPDDNKAETYPTTVAFPGQEVDYSHPVLHQAYSDNTGYHYPVLFMAVQQKTWTQADMQTYVDGSGNHVEAIRDMNVLYNELKATTPQVGGMHPAYADWILTIRQGFNDHTPQSSTSMFPVSGLYGSYLNEPASIITDEDVRKYTQGVKEGRENVKGWTKVTGISPEQINLIDTEGISLLLNYIRNDRIASPDLVSVKIGDYYGMVDKTNLTVTVAIPQTALAAGTLNSDNIEVTSAANTEIIRMDNPGTLADGTEIRYRVTPICPALDVGTAYDSIAKNWTIKVQAGTPYNIVNNFSVAVDGTTYAADIDHNDGTIKLNLPTGANTSSLAYTIDHTGASYTIGGAAASGTIDLNTPKTLVLTHADSDVASKTYTISVEKATGKDILSYSIDGAVGTINGTAISIEVPYATNLTTAEPVITLSPFANVTSPSSLKEGANTYTVTAQDGNSQTYTVNITRTAASTACDILSFGYGNVAGTISGSNITLHLPAGTDIKALQPEIGLSPFATVSPDSGEAQDFSKGAVKYTVTSQSGRQSKVYTVTVTVDATPVENEYKAEMETLLANMIARTKNSTSMETDWHWMTVGLYEGMERHSAADLPSYESFNMRNYIAALDSRVMTDFARVILCLTAMGIDCSNLDAYLQEGEEPFKIADGTEVHNLIEELYNYSGDYTINGPIYALIALDVGAYDVPADAIWTRDVLINKLLAHEYGSDGFDIDMVAMLMQSLAPYQNDPDYGEQVKAKLKEGLDIIRGVKAAPGVTPMYDDFTFQMSMSAGEANSESAAQVICALSSIGYDVHTHPYFTDGTNSVLTKYLEFATSDKTGFKHIHSGGWDDIATYEAAYTLLWYLNFLESGGNPYSLYDQPYNFGADFSAEASILSFAMDNKEGVIDEDAATIQVTLPASTDLDNVTVEYELSEGAEIQSMPTSFVANQPQTIAVLAEDGETVKTYTLTITLDSSMQSSGSSMLTPTIKLQNANQADIPGLSEPTITVDEDGVTWIEYTVPEGVDITKILLSADLSTGATSEADVSGTTTHDLSDWKEFKIWSEDGQYYSIYKVRMVTKQEAVMTAFSLTVDGQVYEGTISNGTIVVTGLPESADLSALVPTMTWTPDTYECLPSPSTPQNFSDTTNTPVEYTLRNDNGDSVTYRVLVYKGSESPGSNPGSTTTPTDAPVQITSFSVLGVNGEINHTAGTINISLPDSNDVSQVMPVVVIPDGCTVSPVSGQVVNLTSPVVYTVSNGKTSKSYTVTVTLVRDIADRMWDELSEITTVRGYQESHPNPYRPKLENIE